MTEKLYIHTHFINRRETRKIIGLNVRDPECKVEKLLWGLFQNYATDMQLYEPFDLNMSVGDETCKEGVAKGAFIESSGMTDVWGSVFVCQKLSGSAEFASRYVTRADSGITGPPLQN